eukprot:GFUD01001642.1.p1 GENE.GFUD01001642.1~~GFUD01001642.1.p1  ORF type:complete len:701 (-),score=240.25 GFUD01001642.1:116-2218(-)
MKETVTSELSEIESLAGLFQQIVEDCKNELPLFDEFIFQTMQLKNSLISTASVFQSFVSTLQKIADAAFNTKGSSTDIGVQLGRIASRHRAMVGHVETVTSLLDGCCTRPLQVRKEEWRERILQLERDHSKDFKKIQSLLKKKTESVKKMEKKMKKGKSEPELIKLRDNMLRDLQARSEIFVEQERMAVMEIFSQERTHFTTFAACLKPVIAEEFAMLSQVEMLSDVMEKVNEIIADPFKNLETENILSYLHKTAIPSSETSSQCSRKSSRSQHSRRISRKSAGDKLQSHSSPARPTALQPDHTAQQPETGQPVARQSVDRSLSPYSVPPPCSLHTEDTVVTGRPPLPQKVHTAPKPALALQDTGDRAGQAELSREKTFQHQSVYNGRLCALQLKKQGKQEHRDKQLMNTEDKKNNDSANRKSDNLKIESLKKSEKADSVSSSSSGSDDDSLHWTQETDPLKTLKCKTPVAVGQTPQNDPHPTQLPRNGVQPNALLASPEHHHPVSPPCVPSAPVNTGSNQTPADIGTRTKPANTFSPSLSRPYISKPISPYISHHPPHPAPIHTPTPALPYPFLVSSQCASSTPSLSTLVQPVQSLLPTTTCTLPTSPPPSTHPLLLHTCHISSPVHGSSPVKYSPLSNTLPSTSFPYSTSSPTPALPPHCSPPIKTIADQTAKAALIRTLITERLSSCSPVPCQHQNQ